MAREKENEVLGAIVSVIMGLIYCLMFAAMCQILAPQAKSSADLIGGIALVFIFHSAGVILAVSGIHDAMRKRAVGEEL